MIIVNKTNNIIYVNGNILQSGNWIDIKQHVFDTINILSDIGSAEIICEYYSRFIKNFGNIIAQKLDSEEEDEIIIRENNVDETEQATKPDDFCSYMNGRTNGA